MLAQLDPKSVERQEKLLTAKPEHSNVKIVGEMRVLLYDDGSLDFQFPMLGRLTLGLLERGTPQMFQALMRARAAQERQANAPAVESHPRDAHK